MKLLPGGRIVLIAGIALLLFITINTLLTNEINESDVLTLTGQFSGIEKIQVKGKVSYSYDLILDNNNVNKIGADLVSCFNVNRFVNEVKEGNELIIKLTPQLGPLRVGSVVFVGNESSTYMDLNCVNREIQSSKKLISIINPLIIALFIGIIVWDIRRSSNTKNG